MESIVVNIGNPRGRDCPSAQTRCAISSFSSLKHDLKPLDLKLAWLNSRRRYANAKTFERCVKVRCNDWKNFITTMLYRKKRNFVPFTSISVKSLLFDFLIFDEEFLLIYNSHFLVIIEINNRKKLAISWRKKQSIKYAISVSVLWKETHEHFHRWKKGKEIRRISIKETRKSLGNEPGARTGQNVNPREKIADKKRNTDRGGRKSKLSTTG